jgi:hypothetical protein
MELHEAVGFFMGEEKVKHKRHTDLGKAFPGLITLSLGNILLEKTHSVLQNSLITRLGACEATWPGGVALTFYRADPAPGWL